MTDYLLDGGILADGKKAQVLVSDGLIAEIETVVSNPTAANAVRVNVDGCIILPGFVDLHTHLREPGREDSETVESGSRAAAKEASLRFRPWPTHFQLQTLPVLLSRFTP